MKGTIMKNAELGFGGKPTDFINYNSIRIKPDWVNDGKAYISGSWRSQMSEHEFSVIVSAKLEWLRTDLIEYGEWNVTENSDEGKYWLCPVIEEVDELAIEMLGIGA